MTCPILGKGLDVDALDVTDPKCRVSPGTKFVPPMAHIEFGDYDGFGPEFAVRCSNPDRLAEFALALLGAATQLRDADSGDAQDAAA